MRTRRPSPTGKNADVGIIVIVDGELVEHSRRYFHVSIYVRTYNVYICTYVVYYIHILYVI